MRARLHLQGQAGSRPLVSGGAEWLSRSRWPEGQGHVPPTVSNLLLSAIIMVTPWPEASYLGDDKWLRKKFCVSGDLMLCPLLNWWQSCCKAEDHEMPQQMWCETSHAGEQAPSTFLLSDLLWRHCQINNCKANKNTIIM